jgi:hypothetical protein
MPNSYGEILTARGGSFVLNNNDEYTGIVYAISVLQDTVFSVLETTDSNGIDADVLNDHFADASLAIKAGALITPMDIAKPFSKIELTSGSVVLVLR